MLARFKFLRGSAFDPFGYTAERQRERQLISDYKGTIKELLTTLSADNHELAVQIASTPEKIRGFGPVKMKNILSVLTETERLLAQWRKPVDRNLPEIKDVA